MMADIGAIFLKTSELGSIHLDQKPTTALTHYSLPVREESALCWDLPTSGLFWFSYDNGL